MKLRLLFLLVSLFITSNVFAQKTESNRPKIGLCLSGGGAKGLAHIGLLKIIDSLHIKVDYITGTSMGGIIGGLYASGWSGKQIDSISRTLDWSILLNQYLTMDNISINEKDEYQKYLAELPIRDKKLIFRGLIEGQALMNMLTKLTRNVSNIHDFNHLPIPFKCMAVDIITVKPVILDKGNLALALRSTMAIPTVFKPVKMGNKLLIDGGLMENFPVQLIRDMGADIVIGSYTGGRYLEEKELNTVDKMLMQTSLFYGIEQAADDIALCNIFSNLTENMKQYSAASFGKSDAIIDKGDLLAKKVLPQLIDLAKKQNSFANAEPNHYLPNFPSNFNVNKIVLDSNLSKFYSKFVRNNLFFKENSEANFRKIDKSTRYLFGTRNFYKIYYDLYNVENKTNTYDVGIKVEPEDKFRIKFALHNDNITGSGFLLNFTTRNWIANNSRMLATVDLSSYFKFRFHFQKYFGNRQDLFYLQYLTEKSVFPDYFYTSGSEVATQDYKINFGNFQMGLSHNIGLNSAISYGLVAEINEIKSKYNYVSIEGNLKSAGSAIGGLNAKFLLNTLDNPNIPKRGNSIFLEYRMIPVSSDFYNFDYKDSTGKLISESYKNDYELYHRVQGRFRNISSYSSRFKQIIDLNFGLILDKQKVNDPNKTYGGTNALYLFDGFTLGGILQRTRINQVPLAGLNENQLNFANFASLKLGLQTQFWNNIYATPTFTFAQVSASSSNLLDNLKNIDFYKTAFNKDNSIVDELGMANKSLAFYTYGFNLAYKSVLGPIIFDISKASINKNWVMSLSIGYQF